jgi:light-regulated signal transduction histidine kinase (bacteriophytochrome)
MGFMESYVELKDSVLNQQTVEQLGELKESYEVNQKEKEILLLQKQNEVLEREQEIEQLRNYIWTGAAVLFGILLLLFISRYRTQKRSSNLLAEKNLKINRQNEELQNVNDLLSQTNDLLEENKKKIEEQNKALESSNEDLRNFASVASHDLKEPLRMINSYTSILKRRYEHLFDDRAIEFMGFVVDGCTRMEQMINSLLDYSRVSLNGAKSKYKLVQSASVVEIVKSNLSYSINQHSATIHVDNPESFPIIRADQNQMMQLFQNLISNAMKFKGERLPVVHIGFKTEGGFHTFYIKDNGIGISKENQEKIFDMLTRLHSKQEYEGTGIGLATVRKIVERHDGKIWVESTAGEGSTFYFTIPVVKQEEPVTA